MTSMLKQEQAPVVDAFLRLLEADIRNGRNINTRPNDLEHFMLANAGHEANLDEDIDGEVTL